MEEQRRIADFLDDQVARIDCIHAQRLSQIDLLRELTVSRISAWTNADAVRVRLKTVVYEVDERAGREVDASELLSVSIHLGVVPRAKITDDEPRSDSLANYKVVRPGDIVLNRMRAFQGGVGVAATEGVCSPDYAVIRPRIPDLSDYLHYVFRADWFVGEMSSRLRGIGSVDQGTVRTPRINVEDLLDIPIPMPEPDIRQDLVDRCERLQNETRALIEQTNSIIALLEERKRAVITAAVTGELDVTTARPIGVEKWVPNVSASVDTAVSEQASAKEASIGGIG